MIIHKDDTQRPLGQPESAGGGEITRIPDSPMANHPRRQRKARKGGAPLPIDVNAMSKPELARLIRENSEALDPAILSHARALREERFGNRVYLRGLIEFTNYCKNDCYYCGIRCSNRKAERYRLSREEILSCCRSGWELGFSTFVLQGGEDPHISDREICDTIHAIKSAYPGCALTLSLGERPAEVYRDFYAAGADRYLLRHETANEDHYARLHPGNLSGAQRKHCLYQLKEIGFQTGAGFMVGSPGQTWEHLAEDLLFLRDLQPHMVGIGPFIPHGDTPLGGEAQGSLQLVLTMLALTRILLPDVLLPATTALGTIHPQGRELGLQHGANVVMPNLSPTSVRGKYMLYQGKICTGEEAAECRCCLEKRVNAAGFTLDLSRGDHPHRERGRAS